MQKPPVVAQGDNGSANVDSADARVCALAEQARTKTRILSLCGAGAVVKCGLQRLRVKGSTWEDEVETLTGQMYDDLS